MKQFTTLFISKEIYNKLLKKKTELTIERGKRVTWDEFLLTLLQNCKDDCYEK